jgi:hypothetical protein
MSRRKKKWKKRGNPLVRFLRPVEAELVASSMTPSSLDSYPPPPPPISTHPIPSIILTPFPFYPSISISILCIVIIYFLYF